MSVTTTTTKITRKYLENKTKEELKDLIFTLLDSQVKINGETSDGYHTFNELYDHRCLLFIALLKSVPDYKYCVIEHFEGWDLLVLHPNGIGQISYHVPKKFRHLYIEWLNEPAEPDAFDGHTSADVLDRLKLLISLT